ncbi:MAG: hypothetical protein JEZ04_22385 [Spirochaetales bacterium]|nr:hypothetical protein [Spirochaetales bacterium]
MSLLGKLLFTLILIIILPVCAMAQTGGSDIDTEVVDGLEVAVDLRLAGNAVSIIPGLSAIIGVPISLGREFITLIPMVGFQYFFDVWTDIHNSYYLPLGLGLVYNPMNVGIELLYYLPVGVTDGKHFLSAAVSGETLLFEISGFSMHFGLSLGPLFVLDASDSRLLFRVNSALLLRYSI